MSAGTAGRILDSANPRDTRAQQKVVSVAAKTREDTGSTSSSVEIEGTCVSKNFDKTVRLQFEKRQEWIREIRGEKLQVVAEDASSAPRLTSSSAASFPGRNEGLGTHCSLIEQKERENSSC